MSLATIIKMAISAGENAVKKFNDLTSGESKSLNKILYIAVAVFIILNLPNIAIVGFFGWMGSVGDSIQIDGGYYADMLHGPIYNMVNDPTFPDNIPWPDDTLQALGYFYEISWNETEMCNTIYHAYLVSDDDSTLVILDKYTKLVEAFADADVINPYNFRIYYDFGLDLSAEEMLALEDCYSYTPPWERDQ